MDSKLCFEDHINNLCKKASKKLNSLARFVTYMYLENKIQVPKTSSIEGIAEALKIPLVFGFG